MCALLRRHSDRQDQQRGGNAHPGGGRIHGEVADTGRGDGRGGAVRERGDWGGMEGRLMAACRWGGRRETDTTRAAGVRHGSRWGWRVGGHLINGAILQPPRATNPGGDRDRRSEMVQTQCPRAAAAAFPAADSGGTSPDKPERSHFQHPAGRWGGGGYPFGGRPGGGPASQSKGRAVRIKGGGVPNTTGGEGGGRTSPCCRTSWIIPGRRGSGPLHGVRCGPAGRTCRCGKSMETSPNTMMSRT